MDADQSQTTGTTTNIDLTQCPFCGGSPIMDSCIDAYNEQYFVRCRSCAAEGPWGRHPVTAAHSWNKRIA